MKVKESLTIQAVADEYNLKNYHSEEGEAYPLHNEQIAIKEPDGSISIYDKWEVLAMMAERGKQ